MQSQTIGNSSNARANFSVGAVDVRQVITITEEEHTPSALAAGYRVAVAAVVGNPLAGQYEEDLSELVDLGERVAKLLIGRLVRLVELDQVVWIGKGAIVGTKGELEHAAALIGPGFAATLRETFGGWRVDRPSTKRIGPRGSIVEVAPDARDLDGQVVGAAPAPFEVRVAGHPREDEAVVVLVAIERPAGELSEATHSAGQA